MRIKRNRKGNRKPTPIANLKQKTYKDPRVGTMALWIETPFGPLYPCSRPAKTMAAGEVQTLQVRARRREYLDKFRSRWCPDASPVYTGEEVTAKPGKDGQPGKPGHKTDYPYRCYVSPEQLAEAMRQMILKIDSEKFKPLVDGPEGLGDPALAGKLHSVYTTCWSDQLALSDGTSSYDHPKYGSKVVTSPPDANSPREICRKQGHYFSHKIDTEHYECGDCPAVLVVSTNKYSYPNGKSMKNWDAPAHKPYAPMHNYNTAGANSLTDSYPASVPSVLHGLTDAEGDPYPESWTNPEATGYPCCKHCTVEEDGEILEADCGEANSHTMPCSLGCNPQPEPVNS